MRVKYSENTALTGLAAVYGWAMLAKTCAKTKLDQVGPGDGTGQVKKVSEFRCKFAFG